MLFRGRNRGLVRPRALGAVGSAVDQWRLVPGAPGAAGISWQLVDMKVS